MTIPKVTDILCILLEIILPCWYIALLHQVVGLTSQPVEKLLLQMFVMSNTRVNHALQTIEFIEPGKTPGETGETIPKYIRLT